MCEETRFCCECGRTLTGKGMLCLECGRRIFGDNFGDKKVST